MRTRFMLWTIWFCFLLRALFYCAALPLWEGYDEYSHFALVQYVAAHSGRFPLGATVPNSSRAVSESRRLTPGAWVVHDDGGGILSYEEFFDLPSAEQKARRASLEKLPVAEWSREEATPREPLYEAQQPPLYYWILAPFYRMTEGFSLPSIVWILRSFTVLIASAAAPLAFFSGRRVFRNDVFALGVALLVTSFPEVFMDIGRVSNEGLSLAIGALSVYLALRISQEAPSTGSGVRFGTALGAALLTKAYFLALVPLAAVVLWRAWIENAASRSRALRQAVAALSFCVAIGGWWYVRNIVITGSLTGQFEDARAMANSSMSLLGAANHAHWAKVIDFILVSHIWLGGWSFLGVRTWMYRIVESIFVAAIVGACMQMVRQGPGLPRRKELELMAIPYMTMVAGLFFHAAQAFRARGSAGTVGYYLYALVVPESILLIAGMARLMPVKMRLLPVPVTALILVGLEQFAVWFVLFPYYAGMIRHNARGGLPTARVGQYWRGAGAFFDRLSAIGPASSPSALEAMAALYVLSTAVLIWLGCIGIPWRLRDPG